MNQKTNRPAGANGGAGTTGQATTGPQRHNTAKRRKDAMRYDKPAWRAHVLNFCVDRSAVYLELPLAVHLLGNRIDMLEIDLRRSEGVILSIDRETARRTGGYVVDNVGDLQWRVPRRYFFRYKI